MSKTQSKKTISPFNASRIGDHSKGYISLNLLPHFSSCIVLLLSLYYGCEFIYFNFYPDVPTIWQLNEKFSMFIFGPLIIFVNLYYYILYKGKFEFIEKFKSNSLAWPWEEDLEKWKVTLKDTIKVYAFNQLVLPSFILIPFLYFFTPVTDKNLIPGFTQFLFHGLVMIICEDFAFYWCHRLLHTPFLYKRIHKVHHKHNNTINLSSVYAHWIEYAFGNCVCALLGMIVLKGHLHVVTLNGFIAFRFMETNEGHCGYDLPWSPFKVFPFSTDTTYHNYHHFKNMGNYGSFFKIWDTVFKTNKDYNNEITHLETKDT